MMKHLYLPIFLLLLAGNTHAQITLQAEDTPQIGDQYIYGIDTAASQYSIGMGGANQIWDFAGITPQTFTTVNIVAPEQAQGYEAFPDATFAVDSDTVLFAQLATDGVYYLGLAGDFLQDGTVLIGRYSTPLKYLEIPTTVGTAFTSTATAKVQVFYPPLGDSARVTRKETNLIEIDGYGTLVTPNGIFNTLRQKRIQILADTIEAKVFGGWTMLNPNSPVDTVISYEWLAKEAKGAVLSVVMGDDGKPETMTFMTNIIPLFIAPVSNFDFSPRSNGTFQFNDRSANMPDTWQWDFGDGATSTEQNPRHTYPGPGDYTACLIVTNQEGADTICKTLTVEPAPVADFEITGVGDGRFNFTDQSTNNPYARRWDFGDGSGSSQRNPAHTYTSPGEYTVCLIATNTGGRDTTCQTITVVLIPDADFEVNAQSQDTYNFTDESTDEPTSWEWDFGDGTTSTEQNPQHVYAAPGVYTVCLTVTNSEGSTTTCQNLEVVFAPEVGFEVDPQGDGVYNFTDNSINTPTNWLWDFGDGNESNAQNPQHMYTTPGDYTVCLTVSNSAGSDTTCQAITVVLVPDADFEIGAQSQDTYNFTDQSTDEPTSWEWDFGDGATSTDQNPQHTYANPGTYTVCLTVTNSEGSTTSCQQLEVVFVPEVSFEIDPQGDGAYNFTDNSTNTPTSWLWDFGDGNTSADQNPQYHYTAPGDYTVCLTVSNSAGSDTICRAITVVLIPDGDFTVESQSESTYNFTDQTINDPVNWLWDFGDGAISEEQNPQHVYDEPGEYTVCLITSNSEGADTTCQALSVVFKPIAGFTYEDQGGGVFNFTDTSRYHPTSWQWDFGDDNTSTQQNPQHTFVQDGNYNVCLVAQNSAGFRVACQNVTVLITDVEDLSAELGLKVFPNPASGQFSVTMDFYQGPPLRLSVSNVLGEVIYRSNIQTRQVVPASNWPQGMYFYRLQNQEGNTIARGSVVVSGR